MSLSDCRSEQTLAGQSGSDDPRESEDASGPHQAGPYVELSVFVCLEDTDLPILVIQHRKGCASAVATG